MTFITHGFRVSVASDVRERVWDKVTSGSPLRFMLRRSSLVLCDSVLHGSRCLQSVDFFFLRQYVQPCLLKNPKYTFYIIKSSLKLAYYMAFWSCGCDMVHKLMHQTTQKVNKHWHGRKGCEKESNTVKGAR